MFLHAISRHSRSSNRPQHPLQHNTYKRNICDYMNCSFSLSGCAPCEAVESSPSSSASTRIDDRLSTLSRPDKYVPLPPPPPPNSHPPEIPPSYRHALVHSCWPPLTIWGEKRLCISRRKTDLRTSCASCLRRGAGWRRRTRTREPLLRPLAPAAE